MRKCAILLLLIVTSLFIGSRVNGQDTPVNDSLRIGHDTSIKRNDPSNEPTSDQDNGIALNIGMPSRAMQPAIRNNMFNLGFGLSILAAYNPFKKSSVLRLGGEIGYTYYGRFKSGGLKTSYGIAHLAPVVRLRPDKASALVPFFDIFGGGDFYISNTKEDLDALETIAGIESYSFGGTISASFVKGLATGVMIRFSKKDLSRLLLRLSYTRGSRIKYVDRKSLDPAYGFLEGRAPVEYFAIQVGIAGIGK